MKPTETAASSGTADDASARLIGCIRDLIGELQPDCAAVAIGIDSVLDRELGIDSLARVELFARIEQEFGGVLPETVFAAAETPRDLLPAVMGPKAATTAGPASAPVVVATDGGAVTLPSDAQTLNQVLDHLTAAHPERTHVHFYADEGAEDMLTYDDLRHGARRLAAFLVFLSLTKAHQ